VSIKCEPYLIAAGHEQLDGPAPQLGDPIRPLGDITNTSSSSSSNTIILFKIFNLNLLFLYILVVVVQ
jgi:hypothetical protein